MAGAADIAPTPPVHPTIELEKPEPPPKTADDTDASRTARILARARTQFRNGLQAAEFFHRWSKIDQEFAMGTWGKQSYQWPEEIWQKRTNHHRPCLTINRTRGFIRMVSNTARGANLRIKVTAVDDAGDPKIAEILQSEIRNIERNSFAEHIYATASDKQAEQGLSFFRLVTEWADDTSFRQRIRMKAVRDQRRVVFDPNGVEEPDFSSCEYVFYLTDVEPDVYEAITGKPAPDPSTTDFSTDTGAIADWFPNGKIRLANYYNVEREEYILIEMGDGRAVKEAEFTALMEQVYLDQARMDLTMDVSPAAIAEAVTLWRKNPELVKRERTVRKKQWMHRIITPTEILEETPWPGTSHALIPVIGEMVENPDTGEMDFRGVTRDAQDAAKFYNVGVSGIAEDMGLGHKSPVVGYKGQFGAEGSAQRRAWEHANQEPVAFLEVDPMPMDDGKYAPLPIRNSYSPPMEASVMAVRQGDQDLKSTAGYHDASMGERGPQESRAAIIARQRQDEHANSHYLFNLRLSLACAGKQLIELIRRVHDAPQVLRVMGDGDRTWKALVYSGADKDPRREEFIERDPQTGQEKPFELPKGVEGLFDISVGEFDVEVSAGPDPGSRRQESVGQMVEVMKVVAPPQAAAMAPHLIRKIDVPDSDIIADAAMRALPPQLQDQDQGEDGQKIPPQVKAEMAAMKGRLDAAMQALHEKDEVIKTKRLDHEARAQSDRLKAWLELVKLYVQEQNADRRLMLERQLDVAGRFLDLNVERITTMQQQPPRAEPPPEVPLPPVEGGVS